MGGSTATFTPGDSIQATGLNNVLDITATASDALVNTVNATVSGVQTANVFASGKIAFNGTGPQGWTGLTTLNTTSVGGDDQTITAAGTTNVNSAVSGGTPGAAVINITGGQNVALTASGTGNITTSGATSNTTITSSATGAAAISVNGGTGVSITATGQTSGTITVGYDSVTPANSVNPTGAVNISATTIGPVTQGSIRVDGGSTVTVTTNTSNAVNTIATQGAVTVNGRGITTAVTVNQRAAATARPAAGSDPGLAGVVNGAVTINDRGTADAADTISTVTLNNFGNTGITSNALATLNLTGGIVENAYASNGNILLTDNASATGTVTSLTTNSNGGDFGTISGTKANEYTSITVNAPLVGSATIFGDLVASSLTDLTINGAGLVLFDQNTLGGATTTNIDARNNSGGVALNGIALANGTRFRGGAGGDFIKITANNTAIDMGEGANTVEIGVSALGSTGSVTAGAGTDDRLIVTAGNAAAATANAGAQALFADKISGFEKLTLTSVTGQTIDLARLNNISDVTQQGATGLTLNNMASGGFVRYNGASTSATVNITGAGASSTDVLNVELINPTAFAAGTLNAANVETINISAFTNSGNYSQTINTSNAARTINLTGTIGAGGIYTLTNADTSVTTFDASLFAGRVIWTTGTLANNSVIRGSATAANNITLASAAGKTVAFTGGANDDTVVINLVNGAGTYSLGNGANVLGGLSNNQNNTVTGGDGNDSIGLGNGNNTIDAGNGNNLVNTGSGNDSISSGTGNDQINAGGGNDTINGGLGADTINGGSGNDVINSGGNTSLVAPDSITGGTGADTISVLDSLNAVIVQNAGDSGANTANLIQTSVIATGFDLITGVSNGAKLNLFGSAGSAPLSISFNAQNLAGTDNSISFARGTLVDGNFVFNTTGSDTLATYDTDLTGSSAFESVVMTNFLVGTATSGTYFGGSNTQITLSSLNA